MKIILFITISLSYGFTFTDAIKKIDSHESVDALKNMALAIREEGGSRGSWGDPTFKIAAKNLPKDSLARDETPMSGIEFGISQKIALTTKYGNIQDS